MLSLVTIGGLSTSKYPYFGDIESSGLLSVRVSWRDLIFFFRVEFFFESDLILAFKLANSSSFWEIISSKLEIKDWKSF